MSRAKVRAIADEALARGDATGWFDRVYEQAEGETSAVPWADLAPNAALVEWSEGLDADGAARTVVFAGHRTLVVGCGLGDDAEWLSERGAQVVAFDVSPRAIAWCQRRFPGSHVRYVVADLLSPPAGWRAAFDFVFEAYTLQSLPIAPRARACAELSALIAPGGTLLLVARGADVPSRPEDGPPWSLTRTELEAAGAGLVPSGFDDFVDAEQTRRFRSWFRAP